MRHSLQIMFISTLMTWHPFWKGIALGGLYRGGPTICIYIYIYIIYVFGVRSAKYK